MNKRIELIFENQQGKNVTIALDDPIEPVNPAAVKLAMDTVIAQNAFTSSGGELIAKKQARIVGRSVEEIDIS
ncbi:DUF2922 domain-containing protein [Anaerobacillus sp. MEB173]|uniref:DUF2922 domain-containing protein n=1 Tax=Anaerobacillus sp. MEB173 TaxID=3383345 RepID=UPI003F8E0DFB